MYPFKLVLEEEVYLLVTSPTDIELDVSTYIDYNTMQNFALSLSLLSSLLLFSLSLFNFSQGKGRQLST